MIDSAQIEFIEADAWTLRMQSLSAPVRERLGTRVRRFGRAVAIATLGADNAVVNRTIGIGLDQPLDEALLAEVNAFFREAGVPRWVVDCGPDAAIVGGPETISRQGGVLKTPTVKLLAELRGEGGGRDGIAIRGNGLSVRKIGPEFADEFRSIVGAAFALPEPAEPILDSVIGEPGWHYYMAFDDERPIAGAAMFVQNDGAWLGVAGTADGARNRGAQTALLARRLADAKQLGCSWATAETATDTAEHPNPSYRNMLRAGLRVAYLRDKYVFVNTRA